MSVFSQPTFYGGSAPGGRASMAGWRAYDQTRIRTGPGGLANLGPIQFTMTGAIAVLYNSNINGSQSSPVGAMGVSPSINFGVHWVVTPHNELDFTIGATLTDYLGHPEYDENSLSLSPGTLLKYNMYVGDFVFTLFDAPSISNSPSQGQGVSNVVNFSQLGNQIGLLALWDLNKLTLNAGVSQAITQTLNSQFGAQNSTQYTVFGGGAYQLTPTLSLGAKGLVSVSDYTQNVLNNYTEYEGGLVIQNRLSAYTILYAEFGMQIYQFASNGVQGVDGPVLVESGGNVTNVAATGGGGNSTEPYINLGITNRLSRYYTHSLTLSYSTNSSGISNSVTQSNVNYSGAWRLSRSVTLNLTLSAEDSSFSGSNTGSSLQLEGGIGFNYFLNRELPVNFQYSYIKQVGQASVPGYVQSIFSVGIAYSF